MEKNSSLRILQTTVDVFLNCISAVRQNLAFSCKLQTFHNKFFPNFLPYRLNDSDGNTGIRRNVDTEHYDVRCSSVPVHLEREMRIPLKTLRKFIIIVLAVLTSIFLVFSIPVLNMLIKGDFKSEKKYSTTEVKMINQEKPPEPPKPKEATRKPSRQNTNSRTPKAGPRFAMNLDVMGAGDGVTVPKDLVAMQSGTGNTGSGDVDERPSLKSSPRFQPPQAIRDGEINASLRISFCVNTSGKPYDIRIIEEIPAGRGLANAGRDAIMGMQFAPAKKDGIAVSFCGLEQPFEIKFRE